MYTAWRYDDAHEMYIGAHETTKLVPGYYTLGIGSYGDPTLKERHLKKEKFCIFSDGAHKSLWKEIEKFWASNNFYEKLGIVHKRGILLYGPPGCGKSSIIANAVNNIISQNGIALNCNSYHDIENFQDMFPLFRQIEKISPIVVVVEDIEHLCQNGMEENLLEMLDGASSVADKVLYIATTNNLNKIPERIRCRPSRIDTLLEIGYPSSKQRGEYLDFFLPKEFSRLRNEIIDNTEEKFSIADLKEIVISIAIYGKELDETLLRLKGNKSKEKR